MKFTENQRRAVFEQGNIIVSAGAGSGKTTVMIARIIEKLKARYAQTDGKSTGLEQMLIVTFTRSAAADMRSKLTEKLYALKTDGKYSRMAADALDALPSANIGTLHSYCQKLVKAYFYAAGVDPSAVVCEESEATAVKLRAVDSAVEHAWESGDPYFADMYDALVTRRSDDEVKNTVAAILDLALSMPDPTAYLTARTPDSDCFAELDGIVAAKRARLVSGVTELKPRLAAAGMAKHATVIDEFCDYADGVIDDITATSHRSQFDITDELNEAFKALKAECKSFRAFAAEVEDAKNTDGAEYSYALRSVAYDAYLRYAERKRALGKMDYSDLEHGAYAVLCDEACLAEVSQSVKYVFIDEFQDVNPLQSAIADKLKRAGAEMFVVGDVKQSIYGFRRCSPEHFIRAVADGDYTHIALADNFRSTEPVIRFINAAFDGVMTKDFGGVDYKDKAQRLVCGDPDRTEGSAGLYVLPAPEKTDASVPTQEGYSVANAAAAINDDNAEASFAADKIADIFATYDVDDAGTVAVLVRSVAGPFCTALTAALDARGIKYSFGKKCKARSFPEVVALADILRCVDNRFDDIALYTAMRSSLGGFSDAELAEIATEGGARAKADGAYPMIGGERRSYALWQKITAYDGRLSQKRDDFLQKREEIVRFALDRDCAEVLGHITALTDHFTRVYESNGNAAAVEAFIAYAAERRCGVHAFLEHYDNNDFELTVSGGGNAVTISTVHASKGLEYDTVILADTAHGFNMRDSYGKVIASERGVFVKVPDKAERTLKKTAPWLLENVRYPDRLRAEELRLLYVALTRAKRTLIVCGTKNERRADDPRSARCMLDFLANVPALPLPDSLREIGEADAPLPADKELIDELKRRHAFVAEYNAARQRSALPLKTCVTAAAHKNAEEEDYTRVAPVLTRDDRDVPTEKPKTDGASALALGTAYHRAMEQVDFAAPDLEKLRERCEGFADVDETAIVRAAAVMKELTAGCAFYAKERYFIVDLPAKLVYGDGAPESNILVQGVIDLLIVDKDGNATVIDYKTGDPRSLDSEAYRIQLGLYRAAVERTTPYKVKRAALYSFASGKLLDI